MSNSHALPRIAFQGARGAFSEEAAIKLLGKKIELVSRSTFAALFSSFDDRVADYLLVPIENTLAGTVQPAYELLLQSGLPVCDEVTIQIEQNLIGCPGACFENITVVESHPIALAQCERFFAEHPQLKRLVSDDTAGSVAQVVRRGDQTRAAIAGRLAAQSYGGVILREHLEDDRQNYTRFVLLAATGAAARP